MFLKWRYDCWYAVFNYQGKKRWWKTGEVDKLHARHAAELHRSKLDSERLLAQVPNAAKDYVVLARKAQVPEAQIWGDVARHWGAHVAQELEAQRPASSGEHAQVQACIAQQVDRKHIEALERDLLEGCRCVDWLIRQLESKPLTSAEAKAMRSVAGKVRRFIANAEEYHNATSERQDAIRREIVAIQEAKVAGRWGQKPLTN